MILVSLRQVWAPQKWHVQPCCGTGYSHLSGRLCLSTPSLLHS